MWKKFSQFFQDGTGAFSAIRLTQISWNLTIIIIVLWELLILKKPPELHTSLVEVTVAVNTAKVVQSFSENFSPSTTP
jgi:hypothetical protein